jgi:hypothetical protein
MRIMVGVGDLVQRNGIGRTSWVLDDRMIEMSGDTLCDLHRACGDEKRGFLGSASKSRSTGCQWFGLRTTGTVCQWFSLKTTGTVFSGLASKPVAMVFFGLASKSVATISFGLASKPVLSFLVEPQNQGGGRFPDLDLKMAATVW